METETTDLYHQINLIQSCRDTAADVLNSRERLRDAAMALIALHDEQVFICGNDDESRVCAALSELRAAIDAA